MKKKHLNLFQNVSLAGILGTSVLIAGCFDYGYNPYSDVQQPHYSPQLSDPILDSQERVRYRRIFVNPDYATSPPYRSAQEHIDAETWRANPFNREEARAAAIRRMQIENQQHRATVQEMHRQWLQRMRR